MADLKTVFDNPIVPTPSGDFASKKGGFDPGDNAGGGNPITTPFHNAIVSVRTDTSETANSESGLPLQNTLYSVGEGEPTNMPDISTGSVPVKGLGKK
jgi:hypothetical protein